MGSNSDANIEALLRKQGITVIAKQDPDYVSTNKSYTGQHEKSQPRAIALPNTAEQVAAIVSQCLATNTPVVVRGGGHDLYGRFTASDAVSIDVRDLSSVRVSADKKTARVAGGTKVLKVLEELEKEQCQAASGSCGTVGFVGWSLPGGMGSYFHSYGWGADQIVGARVVNAEGKLVDADDRLLKGLRGGGGSLAIVVELEVKVHPLQNIQAGMFLYESSDVEKAVTSFLTNYQTLAQDTPMPSQLGIMPFVFVIPGMGVTLGTSFTWNGSATDETSSWIDRVAGLAPRPAGSPDTRTAINQSTPAAFLSQLTVLVPELVKGWPQSASVKTFSKDVIATIAAHAAKIPKDSVGGYNMHIMRAGSPSFSPNAPESVLPYREPHIVLEVLGFAAGDDAAPASTSWALEARNAIMGLEDAYQKVYLPITAPENADLQVIYGDKLAELRQIKKEYDPNGVFKYTIPRLID